MPLCQHAAHYLLHNIPTKAEIQKYRGRNTEIQRRIYGACYLLHKTETQKYRNREIERERICGSMLLAIYCTISRPRPSCYWSLSHIKLRLKDKNLNEKI